MARDLFSGVSEQSRASRHRLDDARALLEKGRWRGSMYLAGYAVECRLKAKLMKMRNCSTLAEVDEILPGHLTVFTHQLLDLLQLTMGADRMRGNLKAWESFNLVNRWMPAWRYSPDLGTSDESETYLEAVDATLHWIDANL